MKSGFSSVGRAPDCRSGGRWFEPGKPDTNLIGQDFRSYSEIASRLLVQAKITGAEPVAT